MMRNRVRFKKKGPMARKFGYAFLSLLLVATAGCQAKKGTSMAIAKQPFGKLSDGATVDLYTFTNTGGMEVRITNFGGNVTSIRVPDRHGKMDDVVLGFDSLAGYQQNPLYFGCIVGRYANRIAGGRFALGGKTFALPQNNGKNHLHGPYHKVLWKARELEGPDGPGVELFYKSPDGEEGYPGNLSVWVTYTLSGTNGLKIDYRATTDRETVINLTNHSYFNLKGEGRGDILDHAVMIHADRFTPVNEDLIPTGELKPVKGTPFDFTAPHAIGERIHQADEQLSYGKGYDHNFVLNKKGNELSLAAWVTEPTTGRVLETFTTEPAVQLYVGNFLDGIRGKGGKPYNPRFGFCLETQHYPDSPNQPSFPSTMLRPGETYASTTVYRFSVQ